MEILLLVVGVLIGMALGYFMARSKNISSPDNEKINRLEKENAILNERSSITEKDKIKIENELIQEREKLSIANSRLAKAEETFFNQKENEKKILEIQERFTKEFENISNKILEEKTQKFTEQNR